MAMYSNALAGWTPVAHADGAAGIASSSYQAVGGRSAGTNVIRMVEAFIGGEASASTPQRMSLRRASANAGTPTDVAPGPLSPFSAAAVHRGYSVAGTGPTIASTTHLGNYAFNAFGGVVRWVAAPGEEIYAVGTTAPNSELILDSISGVGVVSTHMIIEEL